MQSDDLDKKIREAADQHHPVYDENAWNKMHKLLDEHLPVKNENKKKLVTFLLFFLLLSGGIYLLISKPWSKEEGISKTTVLNNDRVETKLPVEVRQKSKSKNREVEEVKQIAPEITIATPRPLLRQSNLHPAAIYDKNKAVIKKDRQITTARISSQGARERNVDPTLIVPDKKTETKNLQLNAVDDKKMGDPGATEDKNPLPDLTGDSKTNNLTDGNQTKDQASVKTANGITAKDEKPSSNIKKVKNPSKRSALGFTLSAGPDINAVHFRNPGKLTFSYGAGLSLNVKKFTLRSGFYLTKKIYSADSNDYHPPAGYWLYNTKLEKVDADCDVYEIPLSISYNFIQSRKSAWFASAGVSSYLMKKEKYNYHYKNSAGQYRTYASTFNDENKHYFSVMTFSGGYERKLSNIVSVMAEPYIKLPLNGIGFGKVKLNSTGVLFTIDIKPFAGKK